MGTLTSPRHMSSPAISDRLPLGAWLCALIIALLGIAVAAPSMAQTESTAAPTSEQNAGQDDNKDSGHNSACSDGVTGLMNGHIDFGAFGECAINSATDPAGTVIDMGKDALNGTSNFAEEKIGDQLQKLVTMIGTGALRGIMWMMTFWLDKPSNIVLSAGGNVDSNGTASNDSNLIFKAQDYTIWLQGLFGVLSILAIALRFVMSRWSAAEDTTQEFLLSLGRIILTSSIWVPLVMLGTKMSDGLSHWILDSATEQANEGMKVFLSNAEFPETWKIAAAWSTGGGSGTAAMVLITSIVSIIASVIQVFMAFIREGMLVILAAVMPMIAYASGTETGRDAWAKAKSWTIALLLYAPAASLVYAIAFLAVGDIGEDDSIGVLGILVLFGMAMLVLPSLITLIAPATGSVPSGGSGMRVAGAIAGAAGTAAAMGAMGGAGAFGGGSKTAAAATPAGSGGWIPVIPVARAVAVVKVPVVVAVISVDPARLVAVGAVEDPNRILAPASLAMLLVCPGPVVDQVQAVVKVPVTVAVGVWAVVDQRPLVGLAVMICQPPNPLTPVGMLVVVRELVTHRQVVSSLPPPVTVVGMVLVVPENPVVPGNHPPPPVAAALPAEPEAVAHRALMVGCHRQARLPPTASAGRRLACQSPVPEPQVVDQPIVSRNRIAPTSHRSPRLKR